MMKYLAALPLLAVSLAAQTPVKTTQSIAGVKVSIYVPAPPTSLLSGCHIHLTSVATPHAVIDVDCAVMTLPSGMPNPKNASLLQFVMPKSTPLGVYSLTWAIVDHEFPTFQPEQIQVTR